MFIGILLFSLPEDKAVDGESVVETYAVLWWGVVEFGWR